MAGAPTKYKEEYNEQAYKLCLLGATDEELAVFFEVCEATINNWKIDKAEFLESIKRGKLIADAEMAESLYKRGRGFEYTEVKEEESEAGYKTTKTTKYYPPDTGAAFIWLKNRQPKKWRDKSSIDLNIDKDTLTDEELNKQIERFEKRK